MRNISLSEIDMTPRSAAAALRSLQTVSERLRVVGDRRAIFPDLYAVITERVLQALRGEAGPRFLEPAWIDRLSGRFAESYLRWLADSQRDTSVASRAWSCAFLCAQEAQKLPLVDGLLGVNAHINYDLAQGIAANVAAVPGGCGLLARYKHDHDQVNQILEASLPLCLERLASRYGDPLMATLLRAPLATRLASKLVLAVLQSWRETVWTDVLALLAAGPQEREQILCRTDRRAAVLAVGLSWGSALPALLHRPAADAPAQAPLTAPVLRLAA